MNTKSSHIKQYTIHRVQNGKSIETEDSIAIEAPLEIRLKRQSDPISKSVAVTMRTPGHDSELAIGFLFTEGIIKKAEQVLEAIEKEENILQISVTDDVNTDLKNADRNFYTTSSCGVCGKASIEAIKVSPEFNTNEQHSINKKEVFNLPKLVEGVQNAFDLTGGIHASSLFNDEGQLMAVFEDVGRHNALDKLIGEQFRKHQLPLNQHCLLLSGRASFELVQKAAMAGIQIIVAIGAPSSLAIELAQEHCITLIGFLKKDRFNIYSGHERIEI